MPKQDMPLNRAQRRYAQRKANRLIKQINRTGDDAKKEVFQNLIVKLREVNKQLEEDNEDGNSNEEN